MDPDVDLPPAPRVRTGAAAHLAVARELVEMAGAALRQHPRPASGGSRRPAPLQTSGASGTGAPVRSPVVLVPGYGGNRSNWFLLERHLRAAGFPVHLAAYDPLTTGLPGIAADLAVDCRRLLAGHATDGLHLVGHSLGGVAVRYAVSHLGLAPEVRTAVTIAAPHRGTPVARLGRGPAAAALRPGSALLAALDDAVPRGVRWLAYYSPLDLIAPPRSARLDVPGLAARNVLVPQEGHVSILHSPVLVRSVVAELLAADEAAAAALNCPSPTPPPAAARSDLAVAC